MAVINKLKCFTNGIRQRTVQGFAQDRSNLIFLMMVLLSIVVGLVEQVEAIPSTQGCNLTVSTFSASGTRTLTPSVGPVQPIQGPVCGDGSCCAPEWEHQLTSDHRNTTERYLRDAITRAAAILETRGQRVDELFRAMMNTSKHDFHTMFVKTYGMIYIQNADVFEDMYRNLETYYAKGSLQLNDMMDHFFSVLYQRMFKVINGDYEYDDKYLECVADHMVALKPFDDVPQKLGQQLRRSFVATRIFYKSLIQGGRVAAEMLQLDLPVEECGAKLTKMHHCGRCLHHTVGPAEGAEGGTRACFWFCRETYTGCLRDYMELGSDWDKYVDAIDKVADRLIGSFNIEMVIQPIDIKISEAIMNFQENREDITSKVFNVCGKPQLKRRRRNTSSYYDDNNEEKVKEIPLKKKKFRNKKKHKKVNKQQEVTMDGFEKEIHEIKTKIKELRQFWSHLPYQLCNNNNAGTVAPPNPTTQCWTGSQVANNSPPASTQAPPTTTSASSRTFVQKQAYMLQTLTFRLKDAYNGQDVNYPDEDNIPPVIEVDGSGDSGSGAGIITDDDIDLDLERGSGDGSLGRHPTITVDNDDDEDNSPHHHRNKLPSSPTSTERKVHLATAAPPPVADTPLPPYYPPPVTTTTTPAVIATIDNGVDRVGSGGATPSGWEVRRTVLQYIMPVVAVWFGNALSSLL